MKHIAVVGAGIAGLACAKALQQDGFKVTVFEKSRGPGGRMSTRWIDREANPPVGFDHGAQYFQAQDASFVQALKQAEAAGLAAQWSARIVNLSYGVVTPHEAHGTRWVGTPGMTNIGRYLSAGLDLQLQTKVLSMALLDNAEQASLATETSPQRFKLAIEQADGQSQVMSDFAAVVLAIPAEQTAALLQNSALPAHSDSLLQLAKQVESNVNWTAMLAFDTPLKLDFDGAYVADSPIGWICRDSSKPGRAPGERWVVQATAGWSELQRMQHANDVATMLSGVFESVVGCAAKPVSSSAHRWLYAIPINPLVAERSYWHVDTKIGACGDWLCGARVEDAYLSGIHLAQRMASDL